MNVFNGAQLTAGPSSPSPISSAPHEKLAMIGVAAREGAS